MRANSLRYNHLKKTGYLPKLQKQHSDLPLVRPWPEETLQAEINELKASTEMLKQQTTQLKKQQANLQAMRERENSGKEKKRKLEERRRRKWVAEKDNIQAAIDDLLGILREEVADFKQGTKASAIDLDGVGKMLESDDRVLGRLGRLADDVIVGGGDEGAKENEVFERVTMLVRKYVFWGLVLPGPFLVPLIENMPFQLLTSSAQISNTICCCS